MKSSIKRNRAENNEDRRWGIYQEQQEQTVRSFCFMSLTGKKNTRKLWIFQADMSLKWKKYLKVAFTENVVDILKLLQAIFKLSI